MKITIAQLNPTIGDFDGNLKLLIGAMEKARKDKSDLVVFSEMFITGYPPRDLLEYKEFISKAQDVLKKIENISKKYPQLGVLVGTVTPTNQTQGNKLYNSAILIQNGKIIGQQHKTLLPTYDVFDEDRYFASNQNIEVMPFKDEILGVSICEDMWNVNEATLKKHYLTDPVAVLAEQGATLLINLSASPFNIGKNKIRYEIIKNHIQKHHLPFIFVNQIGGNDELIFDGKSMAFDKKAKLIDMLPAFKEQVKTIDLRTKKRKDFTAENEITSVHEALVLGLKDYLHKIGFKKIVLGLSGGIDSAVTCCLAVEALGKENVLGITMPSMYSSKGSIDYSKKLAKNLGIKIKNIPITNIYNVYLKELKKHFNRKAADTTEENIQARIRGNILMALSNKFGSLVLSTGNKSELAVGYCTLYGDMSGGLSVISDLPKTIVYKLADHINKNRRIIPRETINVAPSAELRPNQKDQDTLPPYKILDAILELYVDKNSSTAEIIKKGFNPQTVKWIIKAINRNEYKRKQAAPGLKITTKAFGVGRRMPIVAKYDN